MKLFSQRKGFREVRTKLQVESMDMALRNRLWNLIKKYYWEEGRKRTLYPGVFHSFIEKLWDNYFKAPIDTISDYWNRIYEAIRSYFFECEWFNVYDFLEFLVNNFPDKDLNDKFIEKCNRVLEEEMSAYRFVGKQITEITSKEEIAEIEEALESPFKTVNIHLQNALNLMSDRKSPDYRNSIKESISAVEAICRIIVKDDKATLGQALKKIDKEISLHPALIEAFKKLYGYTSSAEGIRHALLEDEEITLSFEDAKFMLVSCSAFINYLISKARKHMGEL